MAPRPAHDGPDRRTSVTRVRLAAADRREHILDAARTVFLRSGLAGARMRDISVLAGINQALIYRHFDSKQELFEAAIAKPFEDTVERLLAYGFDADRYLESPELRRERLANLLHTLLTGLDYLLPLLSVLMFAEPDRGREFYRERVDRTIDVFVEQIEAFSDTWEHRDFDVRLVVLSGLATCVAVNLDTKLGHASSSDRAQLAAALADNILLGLEACPG
ncbi:TetR/AcrR family transcriptional regulator [Paraconexibacter antarcticus]|uniref:TetR/AcrR family transcriptional regulator n=1 Tax=Paraconexibacter antarcticus TaxID=2949664 RepID=A0ABY5DXI4_9ACTN|nr:TetR/AcrR family transcriptional regulator [Paraconexibacter antarcticus]UTI66738.1 TetR/AcrR family transcriptional regulator [Paraconexibacter antarcticus]